MRDMIATAVAFINLGPSVHCLSRKEDYLGNHIEIGKQLSELVISEIQVEDHRNKRFLTGPGPPV